MTTEAWKRLLGDIFKWMGMFSADPEDMIAAVEAEAIAAERARIADGVWGLEGQCHSYSGLYCDSSPCVENVSRAAVLAIVEESWASTGSSRRCCGVASAIPRRA